MPYQTKKATRLPWLCWRTESPSGCSGEVAPTLNMAMAEVEIVASGTMIRAGTNSQRMRVLIMSALSEPDDTE